MVASGSTIGTSIIAGDVYMNFKRFAGFIGWRTCNSIGAAAVKSEIRPGPAAAARQQHEIWAMDFLADRLLFGRRFRVHTLLDECSRYPFSIFGAFSFPSTAVVMKLEEAARDYGYPRCLRVDNGPEHIASPLERWADEHNVELLLIAPGKPTQNAFIESFNARVRDEILNPHRFRTIFEFNNTAESWRLEYIATHPHAGLDGKTPEEFLALYETTATPQIINGLRSIELKILSSHSIDGKYASNATEFWRMMLDRSFKSV